MKERIQPRNRIAICLAIVIISLIAWINPTNSAQSTEKMTIKLNSSLWSVIESLSRQIPFSKHKVETTLSTILLEENTDGNDVFQFFRSEPLELSDGVVLSRIDLRIKRGGGHPGFAVLNVAGTCVTLDEIRRHFGNLTVTEIPRGRSLDDATSHTAFLSWGKLSFGFAERKPSCLAWVSFNPNQGN